MVTFIGSAFLTTVVYFLIQFIANAMMSSGVYLGTTIISTTISKVFPSETSVNTSNFLKAAFNILFPTSLAEANISIEKFVSNLAWGLFGIVFIIAIMKSMTAQMAGQKSESAITVLFHSLVGVILMSFFFGNSLIDYIGWGGNDSLLAWIGSTLSKFMQELGVDKLISSGNSITNWSSMNFTSSSITNYFLQLIMAASLMTNAVQASITFVERIISFALYCAFGPITMALYPLDDTRSHAKQWMVGLFPQVMGIILSLMMWIAFIYFYSNNLVNYSNAADVTYGLIVCVVLLTLCREIEQLFNACGFRTMPAGDAARAALIGMAEMSKAGSMLRSTGGSVASGLGLDKWAKNADTSINRKTGATLQKGLRGVMRNDKDSQKTMPLMKASDVKPAMALAGMVNGLSEQQRGDLQNLSQSGNIIAQKMLKANDQYKGFMESNKNAQKFLKDDKLVLNNGQTPAQMYNSLKQNGATSQSIAQQMSKAYKDTAEKDEKAGTYGKGISQEAIHSALKMNSGNDGMMQVQNKALQEAYSKNGFMLDSSKNNFSTQKQSENANFKAVKNALGDDTADIHAPYANTKTFANTGMGEAYSMLQNSDTKYQEKLQRSDYSNDDYLSDFKDAYQQANGLEFQGSDSDILKARELHQNQTHNRSNDSLNLLRDYLTDGENNMLDETGKVYAFDYGTAFTNEKATANRYTGEEKSDLSYTFANTLNDQGKVKVSDDQYQMLGEMYGFKADRGSLLSSGYKENVTIYKAHDATADCDVLLATTGNIEKDGFVCLGGTDGKDVFGDGNIHNISFGNSTSPDIANSNFKMQLDQQDGTGRIKFTQVIGEDAINHLQHGDD